MALYQVHFIYLFFYVILFICLNLFLQAKLPLKEVS